ncbi:MAG: TatD family nuclease-associated radical SAM protein [Eubacteriales bacterium]
MDLYVYEYDGKAYINLTNRCTNSCTFCIRNHEDGVGGYYLWLTKEPTAQEVIDLLKKDQKDVVFCGFGEPTIKIEELKEIARFVKGYGGNVRINTNGHASAFHGRDIAKELKGIVDVVSISLNNSDPGKYNEVCRSIYGKQGYLHMLQFARDCVANGIAVKFSVMDLIGEEDIEKCRKIAEEIGAGFKVRTYI